MVKSIMSKNKCTLCGNNLVLFSSINKKYCPDCKIHFDWHLDPGQKSVLIDGVTAETVALALENPPITAKEYEDETHGE